MTKLTRSYYCGASYSQIIYETIGNYFDRTCEANPDVRCLGGAPSGHSTVLQSA